MKNEQFGRIEYKKLYKSENMKTILREPSKKFKKFLSMFPFIFKSTKDNKVIRPKSRASAISKKSQADRQTNIFMKKTFEIAIHSTQFLFYHSEG